MTADDLVNRKFHRLPRTLANTLGITDIRASLLPESKATAVAEFQARHDCKHRALDAQVGRPLVPPTATDRVAPAGIANSW